MNHCLTKIAEKAGVGFVFFRTEKAVGALCTKVNRIKSRNEVRGKDHAKQFVACALGLLDALAMWRRNEQILMICAL